VGHLYLLYVSPKLRLPNPNNISFKEAMTTKNLPHKLKEEHQISVSLLDPTKLAPSPKDGCVMHGMEMRSMAEAVAVSDKQ